MSIASLSTTQGPQSVVPGATPSASAGSGQVPFGAQLHALLTGQASGSGATRSAYATPPGHGAPGKAHHHRGHHADTDSNVANDTATGQATAAAPSGSGGGSASNGGVSAGSGGSASSGTGGAQQAMGSTRQAPGGVLLDDLMRGLQAYTATTTLA